MAINSKKAIVTLQPEWEPELERLKKKQFYNETQAEMFRYLILLGLKEQLRKPPVDHWA